MAISFLVSNGVKDEIVIMTVFFVTKFRKETHKGDYKNVCGWET